MLQLGSTNIGAAGAQSAHHIQESGLDGATGSNPHSLALGGTIFGHGASMLLLSLESDKKAQVNQRNRKNSANLARAHAIELDEMSASGRVNLALTFALIMASEHAAAHHLS